RRILNIAAARLNGRHQARVIIAIKAQRSGEVCKPTESNVVKSAAVTKRVASDNPASIVGNLVVILICGLRSQSIGSGSVWSHVEIIRDAIDARELLLELL